MIGRVLERRLMPERVELRIAQAVVFAGAVLIVGYAFIKMAALHLTDAQWLLGLAVVTGLVLQCMILATLIDLKRKGVEQSRDTEPGRQRRSSRADITRAVPEPGSFANWDSSNAATEGCPQVGRATDQGLAVGRA
jgi:hypothetical protein